MEEGHMDRRVCTRGKSPRESWTRGREHTGMLMRGNGLGKGLRKGRGGRRPGAVHLFAQTQGLGV